MKTYHVLYTTKPLTLASPEWETVPAVAMEHGWKEYPSTIYKNEARLVHGKDGVTVRLASSEWPLRATHTVCNEMICEDSCLEFFFAPSESDRSYINIEVNPFGVTHIGLGPEREGRTLLDIEGEGLRIEAAITPRLGWAVMLFVPYTFIDKYCKGRTSVWRGNFYKCGDFTVKEHYAAWNPVDAPAPDYHLYDFFGKFVLEDKKL